LFRFIEHLKVLGCSKATIEAYGEHVKGFLGSVADIKAVTRSRLEVYIAGLFDYRTKEGKPYGPGTIGLKVRSLKRFFEFLEKSNVILINPAELIREPGKKNTLPRNVLSAHDIAAVLDQPNLGTMSGIRDRTILDVFYSTGIRLEELCRLTIYDADLQGGMLRVNSGKGKKDRVVPLGKYAVKFLWEYITKVRPHFTKTNRTERRLFVNRLGAPISDQVVGIMVSTHARAAGIKKQVSPHTFRHTFATGLVKNGADIIAVQRMLGHSDLKTTEIYLRSVGIDVKAAHKKSHPREKDREEPGSAKPAIERMRPEYERKSIQPRNPA